MFSGVVLQGQSNSNTIIEMGPTTQQPSSYIWWGIVWPANSTTAGLADLTIQNLDTLSQKTNNGMTTGPTSKIFIERVNWNLNTGYLMALYYTDRMVVSNCNFKNAINYQQPASVSPLASGIGPLWIQQSTNILFQNNTVLFPTGGNAILTNYNAVIEGNHFSRSATDKIVVTANNMSWLNLDSDAPVKIGDLVNRHIGRQLAVQFSKNLVIQNNIFDVVNGVLTKNLNDGETILDEGGAITDLSDVGTATAASTTSVTGQSKTWKYIAPSAYNAGSRILMVSGAGAGQLRQIVSVSGNTFTVDHPWTITPAAGDNFTLFVPSMENAIIRNNQLSNNTHGIMLFDAGFLNVSILNNSLTNNTGINLNTAQNTAAIGVDHPKMGYMNNIEVLGNTVTNNNGYTSAYIAVDNVLKAPNYIFGWAMNNVEVRNNSIVGFPGTRRYDFPDGAYITYNSFQAQPALYSPNGATPNAIFGTIYQGNNCTNCPAFYVLTTGVSDTIIWNSIINGVPVTKSGATPTVQNNVIWGGATQGATGTIIGHD